MSISFRVTSLSDERQEFVESLDLPEGWTPIIPLSSLFLDPAESVTRLVAFTVSSRSGAAEYPVTYSVIGQADYGLRDQVSVVVSVRAKTGLALVVEDKPDRVIAGQTVRAALRVTNQGNVGLRVHMTLGTGCDGKCTLDPDELDLAPGASAAVAFTMPIPASEGRKGKRIVNIKAVGQGPGGPVEAAATVVFDALPRVTREPDLTRRIPGNVTLKAAGDKDGAGMQVEFSAAGPIDEAETRFIDLSMRLPSIGDKSSFGALDEYRLSYSSPDFGVRVGDQSYGLSTLTDLGRYGRGLGIDVRTSGETEMGAYHVRPLHSSLHEKTTGLYVEHRLQPDSDLRVNWLSRHRDASARTPESDDTVWSLESALKPADWLNLRMEYGQSSRENGPNDTAWRVEGRAKIGSGGDLAFTRTHAGPDYQGYTRDADYTSASGGVRLSDRLSARVAYSQWRNNLALRPEKTSAPREERQQVGIQYQLAPQAHLDLGLERFKRKDLLPPFGFDYQESALTMGLGVSAGDSSYRAELRTGRQRDLLAERTEQATHIRLFASRRVDDRLSLTLYGGLGDSDALDGSRLLGFSNDLGLTATWTPRDNLNIRAWYARHNLSEEDRPARGQGGLDVEIGGNGEQRWALRVRRSDASGGAETDWALAYAFPLSVPVGRDTSAGAIAGRVYDATAPGKPGLADVILWIGDAVAVTDKQGRFVFPRMLPGDYALSVDQRSIGLQRVVDRQMPMELVVKGGRTTRLELGCVMGGAVRGVVLVLPAQTAVDGTAIVGDPSGQRSAEPRGLSGQLIELAGASGQVMRGVTDQAGRFLFDGLQPGQWSLKLYKHGVPAYHSVEQDTFQLTVLASETVEAQFRIIPVRRQIMMLDDSDTPAFVIGTQGKSPDH